MQQQREENARSEAGCAQVSLAAAMLGPEVHVHSTKPCGTFVIYAVP